MFMPYSEPNRAYVTILEGNMIIRQIKIAFKICLYILVDTIPRMDYSVDSSFLYPPSDVVRYQVVTCLSLKYPKISFRFAWSVGSDTKLTYRKLSNIRRTKSRNLNVFRLGR